jgi:hypothetical protein
MQGIYDKLVGMKGLEPNAQLRSLEVLAFPNPRARHTNISLRDMLLYLVGMKGLEPSRLAALVPKTSVSTNSTTSP